MPKIAVRRVDDAYNEAAMLIFDVKVISCVLL